MQYMQWGPRDLDAASPEQVAEIIARLEHQMAAQRERSGEPAWEPHEAGFQFQPDEA